MKLSTSFQLRFHREAGFSALFILLFSLLITGAIEILASNVWFFNIIPYPSPSINSSFPELDVKIKRLWQYGEPNCLFIGSSMTDTGLDPAVFEDLVNRNYQTNFHCFNMGFSSSMVEVSGSVANSIITWHNIDLIVWGISPIDMDPNFSDTRSIVDMPVFTYNTGIPSITGFLYNHFHLPWFLATLPHLQNELYYKALKDFDFSLDMQGMRKTKVIEQINPEGNSVLLQDFKINRDDRDAFQKSISDFKAKGKKLIIVEMPVHPNFYPYLVPGGDVGYQKEFIQPVQKILQSENIPFIRSQEVISSIVDDTHWANKNHLNSNGAIRFTQYLVRTGLKEGALP